MNGWTGKKNTHQKTQEDMQRIEKYGEAELRWVEGQQLYQSI